MSDINASERRLSAALDRIDQLLEAGGRDGQGAMTPKSPNCVTALRRWMQKTRA